MDFVEFMGPPCSSQLLSQRTKFSLSVYVIPLVTPLHVIPPQEAHTHLTDLTNSDEHVQTVVKFDENFSTLVMTLLHRVTYISREQGQHGLFNILNK